MYVLFLIAVIAVLLYVNDRLEHKEFYKQSANFPGPISLPLIGNSKDFLTDSHGNFMTLLRFAKEYGRFYRLWNAGKFYVLCTDYKDAEVILKSNVHITKSESYRFFRPWIGDGALTSSGPHWRKHRKIITPAFHFNILLDFLEVFNRKALIFCDKLAEKLGAEPFDLYHDVKMLTLDNIYETAMGMNMDVQKDSDSEYVRAVKDMCNVASLRFYKVWLMFDAFFKISPFYKIQKRALSVLHKTTEAVIERKSRELQRSRRNAVGEIAVEDDAGENSAYKRKQAFLDLLLKSSEASTLSGKELREEVDTFLFAGHDTVSSGISFALYCLAQHPEVQERAYEEQKRIFGDSDRLPTPRDIQEMTYLERVIKECQRVFPSVPIIGRELTEDLELSGGVVVPKGTQLNILIYSVHRDPRVWSNPDKFDPDNFLPEVVQERPQFTYLPFSAGPRNCLGQKYAMLEMKSTIGIALRKFRFLPSTRPDDEPLIAAELILVSKNGVHIRVEARS